MYGGSFGPHNVTSSGPISWNVNLADHLQSWRLQIELFDIYLMSLLPNMFEHNCGGGRGMTLVYVIFCHMLYSIFVHALLDNLLSKAYRIVLILQYTSS